MMGNTVGWRDGQTKYRVKVDGSVGLVDASERESWAERMFERARRMKGEQRYVTLRPDDEEERVSR